ncbi:hypothetical protein F443_11583 [Phytophthora nicotianae P1569]|uniref:Uncharacterized protein n=1 Tax=Phytophthora nicotianae P1569 TaxID=1317065 RepID=V9EW27_PHYNI|nr:hypothetical protein F443_11583 [Phytophthora nicotianae P1569]
MQGIKCVRILNEQRPDVNEGAHENKSNVRVVKRQLAFVNKKTD